MEQPKLIDNIHECVVDDLKERLSKGSRISVAAASFSIYAFEALKKELENVEELRFIFTSPTFIKEKTKKEKREYYIPKLNRERNLYGTDFEVRLRNQLSQKAIAKECAEWIRKKVKFRSNSSQEQMGGFLHVQKESEYVYLPFNEFTTTQLGCERGNEVYNIVNVLPTPTAEAYLAIFNEQWNNDEKFSDVTDRILEYIETVYQENAPEYIYFIALYHIFNEFLEDISEDVLPNERTGFKNSIIWNKLYNFQRDAALAIINKLEKYNGCILADSVDFLVGKATTTGFLYLVEDVCCYIVNGASGGFVLGTEEFILRCPVIKIVLDSLLELFCSFHMFLSLSVNRIKCNNCQSGSNSYTSVLSYPSNTTRKFSKSCRFANLTVSYAPM